MEELKLRAPAKLNLHLEVLKKRHDGFHDLSSLFTLIELFDDITLKKNSDSIELIESIPIKQNIVFSKGTPRLQKKIKGMINCAINKNFSLE